MSNVSVVDVQQTEGDNAGQRTVYSSPTGSYFPAFGFSQSSDGSQIVLQALTESPG